MNGRRYERTRGSGQKTKGGTKRRLREGGRKEGRVNGRC